MDEVKLMSICPFISEIVHFKIQIWRHSSCLDWNSGPFPGLVLEDSHLPYLWPYACAGAEIEIESFVEILCDWG